MTLYFQTRLWYILSILLNDIRATIEEISSTLAEPGWLLSWRHKRAEAAETLPKTLTYGIGISGVLPVGELSFDQTLDYHVDASKGLELYTWKEAVTQEEIVPILEGLMQSTFFPEATNYYGGLAQALFRSGLVIYVQPSVGDDGAFKEEKLTLDTLAPKGNSADVIVLIVKEGAKLAFTSAFSGGDHTSMVARTIIVLTETDAAVRVSQKETLAQGTMALVVARGIVAGHSSIIWSEVFTGDIHMKSETDNMLIGEDAKGEILQGVIARGSAQYDIFASVQHLASHTHSRIRAAGLGADTSKTVYRGMIDMREGVRAVDGGQEAQFLVLSPKAEVDAIPSLDIASKDVLCTHKLSIAHIKDAHTFYPKLRGLSDVESRALFLEGHFAQVFDGEVYESIMDDIRSAFSALSFPLI